MGCNVKDTVGLHISISSPRIRIDVINASFSRFMRKPDLILIVSRQGSEVQLGLLSVSRNVIPSFFEAYFTAIRFWSRWSNRLHQVKRLIGR